jgi:hypothetical protein
MKLKPTPERVRIVGDHPHRGATGTTNPDRLVQGMVLIELDDKRLAGACFADPANLWPLLPDEDPDHEADPH